MPPDTAALMTQLLSALPQLVALAQAAQAAPAAPSEAEALDEPENAAIGQLAGQIGPLLARVQPLLAGLAPALRDAPAQATTATPVVRDMLTQAAPMLGQLAQVLAPVAGLAVPTPTTPPPRPGATPGTPANALPQLLSFAQLLLQIVGALQALSASRPAEASEALAGDRVPDDAFPSEFVPLAAIGSAAASALPLLLPMLLQLLPALLPLLARLVPALASAVRTGSGLLVPRTAEAEDDDADDWEAHIERAPAAPSYASPYFVTSGEWSAEATVVPQVDATSGFAWTH